MENKNYSNLGEQIKDTVQDALDTMNFNRLNQDISNSVRSALDEAKRGLKGDFKSNNIADDWIKNHNQFGNDRTNMNYNRSTYSRDRQRENDTRDRERAAKEYHRQSSSSYYRNTGVVPRTKNPPGWIPSTLLQVFGYTGSVLFGIAIFVLLILNAALDTVYVLGQVAFGLSPLFAISFFMIFRGNYLKNRLKRYKQYVRLINNKSYCTIKELSSNIAQSDKYVVKDLKKMIQLGMFPEGHLDDQNTCLMLNNETYQQYLKTLTEYKKREQDNIQDSKESLKNDNSSKNVKNAKKTNNTGAKEEYASEELRKTIEEGKSFITKIRRANDAIPGEEISRKLDRLESVISKIFECVKLHPEQLSELKKFMEYYLPTTLKLVTAYEEFDAQPVQGENIRNAKNEIEKTLDTINLAFENLLDSLYEDAAMEISTDISVLETLLKREGLTEKDFDITKGGK
jgi:5-bromo-4-chloroindolyl phosphate hydrolysis protein